MTTISGRIASIGVLSLIVVTTASHPLLACGGPLDVACNIGDTVAKKAIATGALGDAAVAASGGDDAAVRDAFLKSGGMVVVQSGQSYVTKKYVDPALAKADSYCMSAVGTKCSIVLPKLQHDAKGKVLLDEKGNPKIDTSAILPVRQQLGEWKSASYQAANDALRNVPGVNAIFTSDNQWD